jgi:hypothetical protein
MIMIGMRRMMTRRKKMIEMMTRMRMRMRMMKKKKT